MKYKPHFTSILFSILLLEATSCSRIKEQPAYKEKRIEQKEASIDYDAICIVGKKYIIFGPKTDNPFEDQIKATVIITAKQNGYVQYCRDCDIDQKDKALFSRTCKDFVQSTNR